MTKYDSLASFCHGLASFFDSLASFCHGLASFFDSLASFCHGLASFFHSLAFQNDSGVISRHGFGRKSSKNSKKHQIRLKTRKNRLADGKTRIFDESGGQNGLAGWFVDGTGLSRWGGESRTRCHGCAEPSANWRRPPFQRLPHIRQNFLRAQADLR